MVYKIEKLGPIESPQGFLKHYTKVHTLSMYKNELCDEIAAGVCVSENTKTIARLNEALLETFRAIDVFKRADPPPFVCSRHLKLFLFALETDAHELTRELKMGRFAPLRSDSPEDCAYIIRRFMILCDITDEICWALAQDLDQDQEMEHQLGELKKELIEFGGLLALWSPDPSTESRTDIHLVYIALEARELKTRASLHKTSTREHLDTQTPYYEPLYTTQDCRAALSHYRHLCGMEVRLQAWVEEDAHSTRHELLITLKHIRVRAGERLRAWAHKEENPFLCAEMDDTSKGMRDTILHMIGDHPEKQ